MVQMTVQMPSVERSFRALHTVNAVVESRPDVGSSKKRSLGAVSSSTATQTRLRSPPLMPFRRVSPMITSCMCPMPINAMTSTCRW